MAQRGRTVRAIPVQLWRRILHRIARASPGATTLRVWLHRARGVKIEGRVFISANVYIDDEYPQNLTLLDNTALGISCIVITHFRGEGRVVIGPDAFVGPNCVIMPNVRIGKGAVVAAGSVVNRDVPDHTLVGGSPDAKPMARVTVPLGIDERRDRFQRGLRPLHGRPTAGADQKEPD
jgi:serine acetyltransferase